MTTLAQQIVNQAKDANDAMNLSQAITDNVDQDWDNETTTYTFCDSSKLEVNNMDFYIKA